jgi:hypothetical protein
MTNRRAKSRTDAARTACVPLALGSENDVMAKSVHGD